MNKLASVTSICIALAGTVILAALMLITPQALAQSDYGSITLILNETNDKAIIELVQGKRTVRTCKPATEARCFFGGLEAGDYYLKTTGVDLNEPVSIRIMPGKNVTVTRTLVAKSSPTPTPIPTEVKTTPSPSPSPTPTPTPPNQMAAQLIPERTGERVTTEQLAELPNRNQSEAPLLERQTGAVNTSEDTLSGFMFNGQPASQNVLREGGVNSTVIVRSSASFQDTNALFFDVKDRQSIKKYKTFSLDTNNTPAAFGTGTGGQLVENIKSGGEKFNFEVYEYSANDAFSARNFFDFNRKPSLRFNLYGLSLSGPLSDDDKTLAFFNYEGITASSGNTIFAAAPKLTLDAHPTISPMLSTFRANGAAIVHGASESPDFDIIQLEAKNFARRNGVTLRLDHKPSETNSFGFIYMGSRSREDVPDGASGRRNISLDSSHKGIFNYKRDTSKRTNQFIFAVLGEPTKTIAHSINSARPELLTSVFSINEKVPQTGLPDQPRTLGVTTSGSLLSGDFAGRYKRLKPVQFSFIDQVTWSIGKHTITFGGEARLIRTRIEQLFGTTYKFASLSDFLANRAAVEHSGDLGSLTGDTRERTVAQNYYIGYVQDQWKRTNNFSLTYGLRYEYFTPLREVNQRVVNVDPETGFLIPGDVDLYKSRKTNFLPRIGVAWAPKLVGEELELAPTVFGGSFGMHVGPDVFNNILRPITNDRRIVSGAQLTFPTDLTVLASTFNAEKAEAKPFALSRDYTSPIRVYKFDFTVKQEIPLTEEGRKVMPEAFVLLSYVGNRGRNLLLRNFANPIVSVETDPDPTQSAKVRRRFDIDRGGELLRPFGEFEFLTTGGYSSYDSLQTTFKGRLKNFIQLLEFRYTLARNRGNTDGDDVLAAGNPFNYDYDYGYNAADVRHDFGFTAVFKTDCVSCGWLQKPRVKRVLGYLTIAAIGTFRSGVPIDLRLDRPDIVYVDAANNVFMNPGPGRRAVLNVPSGGSSIAAYRPNLVPGISPYLKDDRNFLNPAAFAIPVPGTLGDLPRGAVRGPGVNLVDLSIQKEIHIRKVDERVLTLKFNVDITNVFNWTNFRMPSAKLPNMLGMDVSANELQPGLPFTQAAAGSFGIFTRTFKRKSDLGSSRQIQFGLSLNF
jgi:TonB dependent receptor